MLSVNINSGATFDISNYTLKFTASNPITQNGTLTTTNSKIEYNGTDLADYFNYKYYLCRIKNKQSSRSDSARRHYNTGYIFGYSRRLESERKSYYTYTNCIHERNSGQYCFRNNRTYYNNQKHILSSNLNVGGMGAILTESSNLGSTVIRRAHTVQTGLNGGTSIKRYYDITPTNNSGLNATLVFKYDDSELNGKPEPTLKLFSSTNSGTNWLYMGGTVNIATNEITLPG